MGFFRWLAVAVLLTGWASLGFALELQRGIEKSDLSAHLSLLEDPSGRLQISEVSSSAYASKFKPWEASRGSVNLGFSNSALWVRLTVSRAADAPERWLLEVPYAYNKFLDFYAPGQPAIYTGSGRPVSTRPLFDRFFVFPITVETTPQTFYFRVASNYALSLPLTVWEPNAYSKNALLSNLANALYYGALLALAVYNLFLFFSLKDKRFLLYALFALMLNAGIFSGNGLMQLFIWPSLTAFHEISSQFFLALSGFAGLWFSRLFLQTQQHSPRADIAIQISQWPYLFIALLLISSLAFQSPPGWLFQLLAANGLFSFIIVMTACVQAVRHAVSGIRFFVLAWGILLFGTVIAALRQIDLLPTNTLTSYSLQIASGFEMLLLALALAEIVQSERRARIQAQAEALTANETLIETLRAAEQRLEGAVQDRTARLQESVLRERHLLGQYLRFGAMISHEFRNPLGIIDGQAAMIQKDGEIKEDLRQRVSIIRKTVRRLAELFDLWLAGDRIRLAIDKLEVREISLQSWAPALIAKIPHCSETHRIELQINPESDRVWADSSLLEIAVINLVENACKYSPAGSSIVIQNLESGDHAGLAVVDSGPGIPPEHLAHLGEDYYRADPNGSKGIGLGLSVVKEIAEVHGGRLHIESEAGIGSRFSLLLPKPKHEEK